MNENQVEISTEYSEEEKKARDAVIYSAIDFMQSIIGWKGKDDGMALWEEMFERMPQFNEIKGEVLMKLLTGDLRKVHVKAPNPATGMKVSAIKAVREATGLALKEAKDVIDNIESAGTGAIEIPDREARAKFVKSMTSYGYIAR